ncbi:hypothetical protein RSOLAG1IB_08790 [Rhizoctonia solani AG-1 IB]|uniref:Uncharacterized protein n=1 Tax=Thanatephorus cucumeris (strain AG1-IB / isolate 7/3/14) TaxID=1108050 RepID=A0A0B7FPA2_THACB|nr:hypothetical protein RSOLAG1IB_08790 [Rhizoctonia solani AG-1 IB]
MYIPNVYRFLFPTLSILSAQKPGENEIGEPCQQPPAQVPATYDLCPRMTIRCVKDGNWPKGIVGNIGKKEFCWEAPRCNQCDIGANTEECNLVFPECDNLCEAFAPIPF